MKNLKIEKKVRNLIRLKLDYFLSKSEKKNS